MPQDYYARVPGSNGLADEILANTRVSRPYFAAAITDLPNLAWKLSFGTLFVIVRDRNVSPDSLQFRPHECRQALPDPFAARSRKHSCGWHSCSKALSEEPTGRHS